MLGTAVTDKANDIAISKVKEGNNKYLYITGYTFGDLDGQTLPDK